MTMLSAWTLCEMIRYLFYALSVVDLKVGLVTWLRYTQFIFLYPVGAGSELLALYAALPSIKASSMLSLVMPNRFNATFSLYYALVIFAIMYLPIFPQLYGHMFAQRRKVLGDQPQKQKSH